MGERKRMPSIYPRRTQQNISLTPRQQSYIRANYGRMTVREMCRNIGITENVFQQNRSLMGLERKNTYKARTPVFERIAGYFNVEDYLKELVTI